MSVINAQSVNRVNACFVDALPHSEGMGKRAETEPSEFWARLADAWGKRGLPTSQNGVAKELDMSQGSTRRWFTGDGFPETEVLREIARKGNVTIDWLLDGRLPRSPVAAHTLLGRLIIAWEQLDEQARDLVYRTALGQVAMQRPEPKQAPTPKALEKKVV